MSGAFSRRFVLEERSAAPDGGGGVSEGWRELGAIWASVEPGGAREVFSGGGPAAVATHRACIRYAPHGSAARPKPDQRFREGERVFAILGVTEENDRRARLICWLAEGRLT